MPDMPTVKMPRTIGSINIVETRSAVIEPPADGYGWRTSKPCRRTIQETQKQRYDIDAAGAGVQRQKNCSIVYEKMIVEHRQAIAKLVD